MSIKPPARPMFINLPMGSFMRIDHRETLNPHLMLSWLERFPFRPAWPAESKGMKWDAWMRPKIPIGNLLITDEKYHQHAYDMAVIKDTARRQQLRDQEVHFQISLQDLRDRIERFNRHQNYVRNVLKNRLESERKYHAVDKLNWSRHLLRRKHNEAVAYAEKRESRRMFPITPTFKELLHREKLEQTVAAPGERVALQHTHAGISTFMQTMAGMLTYSRVNLVLAFEVKPKDPTSMAASKRMGIIRNV